MNGFILSYPFHRSLVLAGALPEGAVLPPLLKAFRISLVNNGDLFDLVVLRRGARVLFTTSLVAAMDSVDLVFENGQGILHTRDTPIEIFCISLCGQIELSLGHEEGLPIDPPHR